LIGKNYEIGSAGKLDGQLCDQLGWANGVFELVVPAGIRLQIVHAVAEHYADGVVARSEKLGHVVGVAEDVLGVNRPAGVRTAEVMLLPLIWASY
jgi:hypothetical protein